MHKRKKLGEEYILNQKKKILLGIINVLILQWIKENPMSGKDIMNKILDKFSIFIGPTTMYPFLHSLRKHNLVSTKINKKRKIYFLTNKGKIVNKALIEEYSNIQKDISF